MTEKFNKRINSVFFVGRIHWMMFERKDIYGVLPVFETNQWTIIEDCLKKSRTVCTQFFFFLSSSLSNGNEVVQHTIVIKSQAFHVPDQVRAGCLWRGPVVCGEGNKTAATCSKDVRLNQLDKEVINHVPKKIVERMDFRILNRGLGTWMAEDFQDHFRRNT